VLLRLPIMTCDTGRELPRLASLMRCAVGEKKSPSGGGCLRDESGLRGFPAAFNASKDMFEPASLYRLPLTGLYPLLLPPQVLLLSFPAMDAIAACLTLRLIDQATSARQKSTHAPRKARTAPTTMNTVPCGRVECCMKGAFAV
jgi:hypothetical protein